ncbi:MAG: hypothetical protein BGO98_00565 [Myxococcales bacterium 68-20]|nr:MAG: hypothetical protein BGO98_00565 [Myxococcales bacterium 68-20]
MSESLKPLLREDADEFERALLGSAADEELPPPGARDRAMAALGLSPTPPGGPRGPASTSASAPSGMLAGLVLAATLGAGSAVIAVSWGSSDATDDARTGATAPSNESAAENAHGGATVSGEHVAPPSSAPSPHVAETPAPTITPNALPNARPERATAVPSARRAPEHAPRAPEHARAESLPRDRAYDDALTRETLLVDEARRAVASGDPTRALGLLDAHARDFSPAAFALDADVLRIEALERAGRTADADRLAQAFLVRHVEGSYARRVQAVRDRIRAASAADLR